MRLYIVHQRCCARKIESDSQFQSLIMPANFNFLRRVGVQNKQHQLKYAIFLMRSNVQQQKAAHKRKKLFCSKSCKNHKYITNQFSSINDHTLIGRFCSDPLNHLFFFCFFRKINSLQKQPKIDLKIYHQIHEHNDKGEKSIYVHRMSNDHLGSSTKTE